MTSLLQLWTPGTRIPAGACGWSALGWGDATRWQAADATGCTGWRAPVPTRSVQGGPAAVISALRRRQTRPAAAIVVGRDVEPVLAALAELWPGLAVTGGGASETAPGAPLLVVLLEDGHWQAEHLNVHDAGPGHWRAEGSPRRIERLRRLPDGPWESAASAWQAWRSRCAITAEDWESATLSDSRGRNLHLTPAADGSLSCGADLPADGVLIERHASPAIIAARIAAFCAVPDSLICGCAGLRRLLPGPLAVGSGSVVGFLAGEVAVIDGRPQFGNLLMSRLRRTG